MSKKHRIPDEALRQHVAIVGKTGSGKTYTAKGLVERLLEEGRRVCVLDPTGAWYGLRTLANGKKAGFPVMIFGGEHLIENTQVLHKDVNRAKNSMTNEVFVAMCGEVVRWSMCAEREGAIDDADRTDI